MQNYITEYKRVSLLINTLKLGFLNIISYIYISMIRKVILTLEEWKNSLRVPTPVRNKKKYRRNNKHKNKSYE